MVEFRRTLSDVSVSMEPCDILEEIRFAARNYTDCCIAIAFEEDERGRLDGRSREGRHLSTKAGLSLLGRDRFTPSPFTTCTPPFTRYIYTPPSARYISASDMSIPPSARISTHTLGHSHASCNGACSQLR